MTRLESTRDAIAGVVQYHSLCLLTGGPSDQMNLVVPEGNHMKKY